MPIAVTGATGALGGRVAAELVRGGHDVRLVVRDAARAPELDGPGSVEVVVAPGYHDGEAMARALDGCETALLVSARESEDRLQQHLTAVRAAAAAGVGHLVYTSFLGAAEDATFVLARHHAATEAAIDAAGLTRTFLRDSMYADFVPFFVGEDGVLAAPAGDGAVGFVAREDCAACAIAVLADPAPHAGRSYDLTGPRAWTLAEAAALVGARYEVETEEEAYASRARFGAPDWEVEGWVSSFLAIAAGEMATVSGAVEALTGRPPTALEELLNRG